MEKFLDKNGLEHVSTNIDKKMAQYVSKDRTLNGHDFSDDIVLTAPDLNAVDMQTLNTAVRERIFSKWRDGWPEIWTQPMIDTGRSGLMQVAKEA